MPYDGLSITAACGFIAFGFITGAMVTERLWWLLHGRPLPRPWRPVLRYLAPGTLWRDTMRLVADFVERWDAQNSAKPDSLSSSHEAAGLRLRSSFGTALVPRCSRYGARPPGSPSPV